MTAEELDLIRGLYAAMSRRDVEALRKFADEHPDFEWQSAPDELHTDVRRGREHNVAYSRQLLETFDRLETEIRDVIELGPDAAIFVVHHRVRGASSGVEVERSEAHLWTKRDGRIASLREFATVEDARACAQPS